MKRLEEKTKTILVLATVALILTSVMPFASAGINGDGDSVSNYALISVTQTGPNELTVRVEADFCYACNPNTAGDNGCAPFHHGYPGPPPYLDTYYWCGGETDYFDGRYVAIQVRDSSDAVVGSTKYICNSTNWPLNTTNFQKDIVVSATLTPGSTVTVEADIYCGWCGHYYPTPVSMYVNFPPDCTGAEPSEDMLWPPNHKMVPIQIMGVTDPDGDLVTIEILAIYQDEPTNGLGDGDKSPDAAGIGTDTAMVRRERSGLGDGRVYTIIYSATDERGASCLCYVRVGVPHDVKDTAVNSGPPYYDSTLP